jgi:cation-transporting P-type ATPase I
MTKVMTGTAWETLSAQERAEAVTTCQVFARMTPEHKIDVVQTLERTGLVTAMVGDGANDAAAIRAASVGIGVVARGSDPARSAADVILLDGRIEALLDAMDEGHQLWRRVHSAVSVLLGGNAGEICFALITTLLTGHSALNTRQMRWSTCSPMRCPQPRWPSATRTERERSITTRPGCGATSRFAVRPPPVVPRWRGCSRPFGTARHTATVALIGLVSTQLMQTLIDSNSRAVVQTSLGSLAVMGGVISTPGLSRLFGCTPVGPIGWSQGLLSASAATALSAFAPGLLSRPRGEVQSRLPANVEQEAP